MEPIEQDVWNKKFFFHSIELEPLLPYCYIVIYCNIVPVYAKYPAIVLLYIGMEYKENWMENEGESWKMPS